MTALTLWARQSGWADAIPEKGVRTNREMFPDAEFPELLEEEDEFLCQVLYSVGPGVGTGFGLAGISWQELLAWTRLTGSRLFSWQAEALHQMSRAYAGEFGRASREERSDPPWSGQEALEKRGKKSQEDLKQSLKNLAGRGRAQGLGARKR